MAKQFKIYFSQSDETVRDTIDPDIGEQTLLIREFEIEMLIAIYTIAARVQSAIPDSIECKDVIDQLKNTDKEEFVELTKKDLDYFKNGWAKTAGNRPYSWTETGEGILNQIMTPFDPEKIVKWDPKDNKFKVVETEDPVDKE